MHADTFEQLAVNASLFGAGARYLAEGQELVLEYFEGEAVAGAVPATVVATVVQVEPHMKGESATQQKKHATLDNGAEVMVPAFVRQGDAVVVDTASGEFLRRAAAPG
jgi:elongation factor P